MYDPDYQPRAGGVFEIRVNSKSSFSVKFPNIWMSYKLPKITEKTVYDSSVYDSIYDVWLSNQVQFWQNQLNFALWCATTGCGLPKEYLNHENPMIKSVFRFHSYYQIWRILSEMSCPLPTEESWNPLDNGIDTSAFERISNQFNLDLKSNWRQRYDLSNGMGSFFFNKHYYKWKFVTTKRWSEPTNGGNYSSDMDWKISFHGDTWGGVDTQKDKILYIKQLFDHDPGLTDRSIRKGDSIAALCSFVADFSDGFTRAGISRIDDSIRVYSWAILGAQAQARSGILGGGKAFDAQKQFLANVEDSINLSVDLPGSIDRYQRTLQYAKSKLDFVIGHGLYMLPSNMDLHIGTVNGYNKLIQISTDDMKVGYNPKVNDEPVPPILSTIQIENNFPLPEEDDFSQPEDGPQVPDSTKYKAHEIKELATLEQEETRAKEEAQEQSPAGQAIAAEKKEQQAAKQAVDELILTHDDKKLSIILAAIAIGSAIAFCKK